MEQEKGLFENRSKSSFILRLMRNLFLALVLIVISLFIGMLGYSYFEKMTWVDAYVNAAMILSGMGPVNPLQTDGGKLFAGSYALFSGIIFFGHHRINYSSTFCTFLS